VQGPLLRTRLEALHKLASSRLGLPIGIARLIQIAISALKIHHQVRIYHTTSWYGVTQKEINSLLERCTDALRDMLAWSNMWQPGSYFAQQEPNPTLFTSKFVWDHSKAAETVSMYYRKDWLKVCLYKLLVHVAGQRCINQLQRMLIDSGEENGEELETLKETNERIQTALESVAEEIINFVPTFFDQFSSEHKENKGVDYC
jgi:hypothetical protein